MDVTNVPLRNFITVGEIITENKTFIVSDDNREEIVKLLKDLEGKLIIENNDSIVHVVWEVVHGYIHNTDHKTILILFKGKGYIHITTGAEIIINDSTIVVNQTMPYKELKSYGKEVSFDIQILKIEEKRNFDRTYRSDGKDIKDFNIIL